jgi:hypothetical protein
MTYLAKRKNDSMQATDWSSWDPMAYIKFKLDKNKFWFARFKKDHR